MNGRREREELFCVVDRGTSLRHFAMVAKFLNEK